MNEPRKIKRVLIANRGEIARRILSTLHRLEIESVAIFHAVDADSPFVAEAKHATEIFGDTPTAAYLDAAQIIQIAKETEADAIHPGYGFLAENGDFAESVQQAGLIFIGPDPQAIRLMGDKVASREFVAKHGFPLAPSIPSHADKGALLAAARDIGFPVLIKAAAGGGGKGMHIVDNPDDFDRAFELASSEAERYFGDARVYCEKYLVNPRHIEVQILADQHGQVLHLGERECSIQRRFQKIIEETPAPNLSAATREKICAVAVGIAKSASYTNAGTVEFIMGADEEFYFLEMNTRLQVEHPVTEMVTGIDLVEQQIRVAERHPLNFSQDDVRSSGHAIEGRICAEDADADFLPATGKVLFLKEPSTAGTRFDSSLSMGTEVTSAFDPMLAKLITHGESRDDARKRLIAALEELIILGVTTNNAYLRNLLRHPDFIAGLTHTHFIADNQAALASAELNEESAAVLLAAAALNDRLFLRQIDKTLDLYLAMGRWRNA
ncbi:MAG: biotin carboxylase N-terminal domain-containing protein [Pseudomonadota bacterium]